MSRPPEHWMRRFLMTIGPVRTLRRIVVFVLIGYLFLLLLLMYNENSLVFPGSSVDRGNWAPTHFHFEDVSLTAADGVQIHGWYFKHPSARHVGLYFHGNAENVAEVGETVDRLRESCQMSILVIDYRGFGKSNGSPTEKGVVADGLAAMDWVCERTNKQPNDIVVIGRSLGGGVANQVVGKTGCKALVLHSTFSTIQETAAKKYFYVPVKLLMQNKFDSVSQIKKIKAPTRIFHGDVDRLIPFDQGKKLFAASGSDDKKFYKLAGFGHNGYSPELFWQETQRFLEELE